MNPPSALHGAMGRERKPFTYTPGGIDLSQIKSERMAKRLMRNAMDQGVPEHPTANIQSPPPTMSTTLNVPNYNCLPVQVFPTFPLPTNPKSLLKTRTNSVEQKDRQVCQKETIMPHTEDLTTNTYCVAPQQNLAEDKNHILSHFESKYENNNNEQYFPPYEYNVATTARPYPNYGSSNNTESILPKVKTDTENFVYFNNTQGPFNKSTYKTVEDKYDIYDPEPVITSNSDGSTPLLESIYSSENNLTHQLDETMETDIKQKEVKVVKKQAKTENVTEGQNGDTDVQAAVTVKLPGKKSAAKTETKVEVVKKVLPDGSIEEVKTTTTKTTIDGKTEITTKTETTIIPKEDDDEEEEEEEVVEEEEEEEQEDKVVESKEDSEKLVQVNENQEKNVDEQEFEEVNEEGDDSDKNIKKQEETSESSVIKKVTIVQSTSQESFQDDLEHEEQEQKQDIQQKDDEEEVVIESKKEISELNEVMTNGEAESEDDEQEHEEIDDAENITKEENNLDKEDDHDTEVESEKEEVEETVDTRITNEENSSAPVEDKNEEILEQTDRNEEEKKIQDDSDISETLKEEEKEDNNIEQEENNDNTQEESPECTPENKEEIIIEVQVLKPGLVTKEEEAIVESSESKPSLQTERNIPLREPSVPLEKVEDVEIKPIGQIISKSHTENTKIITTSLDKPTTGLSTQTAYNRIENVVTVNRTTKTLDHAYEQFSQHTVPMVKTSFVPNLENLSSSPQLSRPYQPVYPPEPQTERRHSLLLDRLSVDRQMPSTELYQNNYQFSNQNYEQNQWSQEPQSEVLTVSNVKPSTITKNQQWYQQAKKEDINYNTAAPTLNVPSQQWNPQQAQSQQQQYLQPQPQVNYQPQPQFQPSYVETEDSFKTKSNISSIYKQNSFPTYAPKPTSWVNNNVMSRNTATPTINKPLNQFLNTENDNTESYLKPTHQFSSTYVPPPWEQDSQNVVVDDMKLSYYSPSTTNKFSNNTPTKWTPTPTSKFSKPKPTSYIPPAPNQSFVKPVTTIDPPKLPGRKTYYSEYERRYISVPESTYIPTENKFQAQPDPSPQYFYDNNEPTETIEPEWRKELREFSEKTHTQGQYEQFSVKPPWEEDPKYYVPKVTTEYNPTPTWSQTLRPNTWQERSFESEFVRSKELPRTNTLGRGRPQSSYVKSNVSAPIPERPRGVSVDRYNSNTYKSPVPSEYPPVVSHTLDPSIGSKTYHNPNVPAYHSRASAEPREQSAAIPQARQWGESRAPPVQSRSFKYLQWITGTED